MENEIIKVKDVQKIIDVTLDRWEKLEKAESIEQIHQIYNGTGCGFCVLFREIRELVQDDNLDCTEFCPVNNSEVGCCTEHNDLWEETLEKRIKAASDLVKRVKAFDPKQIANDINEFMERR